ncbi:hypothetical protein F6B41_23760 [Microbacterium lushaniae]|nr:hypothetical protein F6B41_23760 [Microbacterium lushaniae]
MLPHEHGLWLEPVEVARLVFALRLPMRRMRRYLALSDSTLVTRLADVTMMLMQLKEKSGLDK